jgi:hypothetical protein
MNDAFDECLPAKAVMKQEFPHILKRFFFSLLINQPLVIYQQQNPSDNAWLTLERVGQRRFKYLGFQESRHRRPSVLALLRTNGCASADPKSATKSDVSLIPGAIKCPVVSKLVIVWRRKRSITNGTLLAFLWSRQHTRAARPDAAIARMIYRVGAGVGAGVDAGAAGVSRGSAIRLDAGAAGC